MMNNRTIGPRVLVALFVALTACKRAEEKEEPTKTIDIIPAGASEPSSNAAPSKIGTLPLMAAIQPGGKCEVVPYGGFNAITRDVRYEENFPPRFLKLGIGDSTRAYAPVKFDVSVRRESGINQAEVENIQLVFTATGSLQMGSRQYTASDNGTRERRDLTSQEVEEAKQLVAQLLETCKGP